MDLGIRGRTALVTGSSRGIGLAVADALAREGVRLALAARDGARLAEAARAIEARHGGAVVPLACDLADAEAIPGLVRSARAALGSIDILVTNAGGPPAGPALELGDQDWARAFDLTLMSVVRLCRAVLPDMKARGWGRVVHLTSISVKQPIPRLVLSNALRAAVAGFSKTLANEAAGAGITMNCVATGYTATERLAELAEGSARSLGITEDEVRAGWIAAIPAGRLAAPEEIGDLVAFLASARAAYINGAVVPIDGGSTQGLL